MNPAVRNKSLLYIAQQLIQRAEPGRHRHPMNCNHRTDYPAHADRGVRGGRPIDKFLAAVPPLITNVISAQK